jgi:hypothetical protein
MFWTTAQRLPAILIAGFTSLATYPFCYAENETLQGLNAATFIYPQRAVLAEKHVRSKANTRLARPLRQRLQTAFLTMLPFRLGGFPPSTWG